MNTTANHGPIAISGVLLSLVLVLGAAAVQAQAIDVETGYPANVVPTVAASPDSVPDVELFLIQENEGPIEERTAIVDSSVDPDFVRIGAGAEPPFDIGRVA